MYETTSDIQFKDENTTSVDSSIISYHFNLLQEAIEKQRFKEILNKHLLKYIYILKELAKS